MTPQGHCETLEVGGGREKTAFFLTSQLAPLPNFNITYFYCEGILHMFESHVTHAHFSDSTLLLLGIMPMWKNMFTKLKITEFYT